MSRTAKKTDPKLWEEVKEDVTSSAKGGREGQWSARKAQMATQEYRSRGGGYEGRKSENNSLDNWQQEDWGTKSGRKSTETGERYLPKAARKALSAKEYKRTSDKKRRDTAKGRQFSGQPEDIAKKTAKHREPHRGAGEETKAGLYEEARKRDLPGRSKMSKRELARALGR